MNRPTNIRELLSLGWLPESPLRDYLWGSIIIALAILTVVGAFFLFGN